MTHDPAALRSGKGHRDENFPVASRLIHPRHRGAILAFYEFVRIADDIADQHHLRQRAALGLGRIADRAQVTFVEMFQAGELQTLFDQKGVVSAAA